MTTTIESQIAQADQRIAELEKIIQRRIADEAVDQLAVLIDAKAQAQTEIGQLQQLKQELQARHEAEQAEAKRQSQLEQIETLNVELNSAHSAIEVLADDINTLSIQLAAKLKELKALADSNGYVTGEIARLQDSTDPLLNEWGQPQRRERQQLLSVGEITLPKVTRNNPEAHELWMPYWSCVKQHFNLF